ALQGAKASRSALLQQYLIRTLKQCADLWAIKSFVKHLQSHPYLGFIAQKQQAPNQIMIRGLFYLAYRLEF
ncbi:MAG TPA: hypothetical protein VGB77_20280, partial [Abditibacteriaceae bacterium]